MQVYPFGKQLQTRSVNRNDHSHYIARCLDLLEGQVKELEQKIEQKPISGVMIRNLQTYRWKREKEQIQNQIKTIKEREDPDIIA